MKKSLLLTAAIASAIAANAEVFDYSFRYNDNAAMPFISLIGDESSEFYLPGNYDFIDKYGKAMPNVDGIPVLNTPEGGEKGLPDLGVAISLYDGGVYKISPDAYVGGDQELEDMPEENYNYPFISWGEKGMTRTVLMAGWGSEEEWIDENYNGATADDWVATKNGLSFIRLGTQNIVSRQDTYVQFPAVTGNVTVTVWAGTASDKTNPDQNINVKVTPVVDGVAMEDDAKVLLKETGTFVEKRMYKMDPVTFDATGKNMAFQIGCNGNILHIYYVRIEGEAAGAGVSSIIMDNADVNAPAFNVMGQQVDFNYKGIVIKNGKKFYQR